MKKFNVLVLVILIVFLSGCKNPDSEVTNNIVLPNINGLNETEIREIFFDLDHEISFEYYFEESEENSNLFIEYKDANIGDVVSVNHETIIIVYPVYYLDTTFISLPDLTGLNRNEIDIIFNDLDIDVIYVVIGEATEITENQFVEYGNYLEIGSSFDTTHALPIIILPEYNENGLYFSPIEMVYDGPYLSNEFQYIDPIDPRGGYFDVTLKYCTDGDTAVFNYPQDIYDAIESYAKSTRFLNMDTKETYSGGEEEWGKPASVYTCELLTNAEEIRLQTDPGDELLGNYGRLLAWIWVKLPNQDEFYLLNYMVVQQGLAQVEYEFGAGETISYGLHTYNEWMHIAEDYAIENNLGQWGNLLDYYWDYTNDEPNYSNWY